MWLLLSWAAACVRPTTVRWSHCDPVGRVWRGIRRQDVRGHFTQRGIKYCCLLSRESECQHYLQLQGNVGIDLSDASDGGADINVVGGPAQVGLGSGVARDEVLFVDVLGRSEHHAWLTVPARKHAQQGQHLVDVLRAQMACGLREAAHSHALSAQFRLQGLVGKPIAHEIGDTACAEVLGVSWKPIECSWERMGNKPLARWLRVQCETVFFLLACML